MDKQKWEVWVDGRKAFPISTDKNLGAQAVLNKAKRVWPGKKIEVVATI